MKTISIAIPTYNRSARLRQTLTNLATQAGFLDEDIELVISDNGSPDPTAEVVREFSQKTGKAITFNRNSENLGIDGNIDKVADLATGRFILFMSDDDILRKDGLLFLKRLVAENTNLVFAFLNGGSFTGDFQEGVVLPQLVRMPNQLTTYSHDEVVGHLWIWATFVSSFFVERSAWLSVHDRKRFVGTDIYLTHVLFRLLSAAPSKSKIITSVQLVAARAEYTGSFRILHAFAVSFMSLICKDAHSLGYSKETLRRVKLRTIKGGLPSMVLMVRRGLGRKSLTIADYKSIFKFTWWEPTAWLYIAPMAFTPMAVLEGLRRLKRAVVAIARPEPRIE